jgi:hypothetical protein
MRYKTPGWVPKCRPFKWGVQRGTYFGAKAYRSINGRIFTYTTRQERIAAHFAAAEESKAHYATH